MSDNANVAIKRMLYEGGHFEAELDAEQMGDALTVLFGGLIDLLNSTEGAFNFLSLDLKPSGESNPVRVVVFRPGRAPSIDALKRAVDEREGADV